MSFTQATNPATPVKVPIKSPDKPELRKKRFLLSGFLIGFSLLLLSQYVPIFPTLGLQAAGPMLAIALVVFSLFGDLPPQFAWMQRLGSWLFLGIAIGTICLLAINLALNGSFAALNAFSPNVWAAYISIVLVSLSFQQSTLPARLYQYCKTLNIGPALLIPCYVCIVGLLGNIFDGVSIIAISTVIFLALLERTWAMRAAFALLFGGLISNLITVAAEPTNIKFQDVLGPVLTQSDTHFWLNNWPISVLGILFPALSLALWMRAAHVSWHVQHTESADHLLHPGGRGTLELLFSLLSICLLGLGILVHATLTAATASEQFPLWQLLLPSGIVAIVHLCITRSRTVVVQHLQEQWPVWGKLMVIFSLLWFLTYGLTQTSNVLNAFFAWPNWIQYGFTLILALLSSVTDNVAIAAMLGNIALIHPFALWQIRLLLILLTWSGGFTPFGCLQSLSLNSSLELSTAAWFSQTLRWGAISLLGGIVGLLITILWR